MQRFKKVLAALDIHADNRMLLDHAVGLCARNQGHLTLITVQENLTRSTGVTSSWVKDLQKLLMEAQRVELNQVLATVRHRGVNADAVVLCGTPFLEIIRQVLRANHDLVMVAGGESSGLGSFFLGSTTMNLMRKCPCPVWAIKASQTDGFKRILAAVDPNPSDPIQEGLNRKILDLATSLARLGHSKLHIVHAWSTATEPFNHWGDFGLPTSEAARMADETRDLHERWLAALLAEDVRDDLAHQVHLLRGSPRKLIPEVAKAEAIDLIVMGTLCRTGVSGFLIGNTAESVLRRVDCSVLAIKPEGYVTPVRLNGQ